MIAFIIIIIIFGLFCMCASEPFVVGSSYLRPNFESGANMLRGDLPIQPVNQSWFNSSFAPPGPNFVQGFFNT